MTYIKGIVAAVLAVFSSSVFASGLVSDMIGGSPGELGGYSRVAGSYILVSDGSGYKGNVSFEIFEDFAIVGSYTSITRDFGSTFKYEFSESAFSVGAEANQKFDFFPDTPILNASDITVGATIDFYSFEAKYKRDYFFRNRVFYEEDKTLLNINASFRSQLTDKLQSRVYTSVCLNCNGLRSDSTRSDGLFGLRAGINYAISKRLQATVDVDPRAGGEFLGYVEAGLEFRLD